MHLKLTCNLKWLVSKAGYNQKEVADMIGVTEQQFSKWTKGKAFPRSDRLFQVYAILKQRLEDLRLEDLYTIEVNEDAKKTDTE